MWLGHQNLLPIFGSSFDSYLSTHFVMPPLAVPVVAQLRVLGRKWEELHPDTDPGTLDRATRLGCIKARRPFGWHIT